MSRAGQALRALSLLLSTSLLALPASAHVSEPDFDGRYWIDQDEPEAAFVDPRLTDPRELPLEGLSTVPMRLPFVFSYYGKTYDHVRATGDGSLVLSFLGGRHRVTGDNGVETERLVRPRDDEAILDVFHGVFPGPDSKLLFDTDGGRVTFRWAYFLTGETEPVVFEAHLREDGAIRFQYLMMAPYLEGPSYGRRGTIGLRDAAGRTMLQPLANGVPDVGFVLRSGGVVEFPTDPLPDPDPRPNEVMCPPAFGLPPDPPTWCDLAIAGPDRMAGTADDNPSCIIVLRQPCDVTVTQNWGFDEQAFCANCPYVYYVRVDCGNDMHIPTNDVEAMSVSVTDMMTGAPQMLQARNECAMRADMGDPFVYCDGCANPLAQAIFPKDDVFGDKPAGSCTSAVAGTFPEIPCFEYRQDDFVVGWGTPIDRANPDSDGSGVVEADEMEVPPCVTCDQAPAGPCPCGQSTQANRVTEAQVIDILLEADFLTGVFRLDILSGGFFWDLFTNCDGTDTPQYSIYSSCAEALADYRPLPELSLAEGPDSFTIVDASGCPNQVVVSVSMTNFGGAEAMDAPFEISFEDGMGLPVGVPFNDDMAGASSDPACAALGPMVVGETRTCTFTVPLDGVTLDQRATVLVDPVDMVRECSEEPTAARCSIDIARRERTIPACASECVIEAAGTVDPDPVCLGQPITIDAEDTTVAGCLGMLEYRYEERVGMDFEPIQGDPAADWSPNSTYQFIPVRQGADPTMEEQQRVWVSVRCDADPDCESRSFFIEYTVLPDRDDDGVCDQDDNCVDFSNPAQLDADSDGVGDDCDNCPGDFNPGQENPDGDGFGNECDNCDDVVNDDQLDTDADEVGDACDNCPTLANNDITDQDGDTFVSQDVWGEFQQSDIDNDGVGDLCDNCISRMFDAEDFNPAHAFPVDCNGDGDTDDPDEQIGQQCDQDGDGVGDECDNCPTTPNPRTTDPAGGDCDGDPGQDLAPPADWLEQCDSDFDDRNGNGIWEPNDPIAPEEEMPDGIGDGCDNCATAFNPPQTNSDSEDFTDENGNGVYDMGEPFDDANGNSVWDGDDAGNACDPCPFTPGIDPADCLCTFGAPGEVLTGLFGDDHLAIRKSSADPGNVWITSEDAFGNPSLQFFGLGTNPNIIDHYNVYRGDLIGGLLAGTPAMPGYDHAPWTGDTGCAVTDAEAPVYDPEACGGDPSCPGDGNSYYYVVNGECAAQSLEGPLGPTDTPRPAAMPCP